MSSAFNDFQAGSSILLERQELAIREAKEGLFDDLLNRARGEILRIRRSEYKPEEVIEKTREVIMTEWPGISYDLREAITKEVVDELQGFGPVAELIEDPEVSDIIILHSKRISYQKNGHMYLYEKNGSPVGFKNIGHLRMQIEKLCMMGYARIDESNPGAVFSAQGMRITAAIPPIYYSGDNDCTIAIRKFIKVPTLEEMVAEGSISEAAALFMKYSSQGKMNLGFTGLMGTGKTTQIAILARYIHPMELPILIEQVQECPIDIPNLRRLICRPPNMEGKGEIGFDSLFRLSLTSNGTRIWMSEVKGGEAFTVFDALNSGHNGWLTFHAYNSKEAVTKRLPAMVMQNRNLSQSYNPSMLIGNSLEFICTQEQYKGQRRYKEITEIVYNEDTQRCEVRPIFERQNGELRATGYIPEEKLEKMDYYLEEMDYSKIDRAIFEK